jgi:hypothetical protein
MPSARCAMSNASTFPVSMTSGITLAAMSIAMKMDAIGSKPVQPYNWMRSVETITPTEPSVSYRWRPVQTSVSKSVNKVEGSETHSHDMQKEAAHIMTMSLARMPTAMDV